MSTPAMLDRVPAYLRYVAVSAIALMIDSGSFWLMIDRHVPAVTAAGLGYALGIGAHWLMSTRAVFADRLAPSERGQRAQAAMFVLTGLVGLAMTMAIVGTGEALGLDPRLAKLIAIAISFQSTWLLRRRIVFA